ncbi:MAG: dihydroorotase, partial [Pseudomonadota bacterium]
HVSAGRLTLAQFVALTAHNLEPVFGTIGKGRIVEGYDADFTVVDLRVKRTITRDWVESRSGWSPFEGREVTGWPMGTIIRGQTAMWEGEIAPRLDAQPIRFTQAGE